MKLTLEVSCECSTHNVSSSFSIVPRTVREIESIKTVFTEPMECILYRRKSAYCSSFCLCFSCLLPESWLGAWCVLQDAVRLNVWKKDEDYVRMDGSTGAQSRKRFTTNFNDVTNERSAPLKLRPYCAIQICLSLLLFFYTPDSKDRRG